MKRIWFKPDCIEWIRSGKKTTTWRSRRHIGEYIVVKGSRFKAVPIEPRLIIKLTPLIQIDIEGLMCFYYDKEGDFNTAHEFEIWLKKNKVYSDKVGTVHTIEVLDEHSSQEGSKELSK
jgi:hypothetical protein